jgi:glutathione-regulated potassium-efflux system ancillary protein KefC
MEVPLLLVALALGFVARAVKLPPLVGFLIAGFVLHAFGMESSDAIDWIADIGVLLLLFGVGLKLQIGTLAKPAVWATTSAFSVGATVIYGSVLFGAGALGLPLASDLDLRSAAVVGFALSFASTVFAVQTLERAGETRSLAGRLSIGVLVLQDLFAVAFLVATGDGWPSPWALLLIPGFIIFRPLAWWMLDRAGHGEILVLLGITMAVAVGAGVFDFVGLKPDLGALVAGLMLSGHPRASELSTTLLGFKDLFLVGFFLSIGLAGTPPLEAWIIGVALLVAAPLRTGAFLWLFTRFRLRSRTSLHSSLTLSTYSEFGLIVGAAAVSAGYITQDWVSTVAVAVAGSFIGASWADGNRYRLYERWSAPLARLERRPIQIDDAVVDCGWARVLIFGMGRIGEGAYDELVAVRGGSVVGVDRSREVVDAQLRAGRSVVRGDALDLDFWERFRFHPEVELVFAAMNSQEANLECIRRVQTFLPHARIAAIARYRDQVAELRDAGVDVARNLYEEAGQALAADAVAEVWASPDDDGTPGSGPLRR